MNHIIRDQLVQIDGFTEITFLERYLGVPLTRRASKKDDCKYIIDQVHAILTSLKGSQLAFAGRVTLAKSEI